MQNPTQIPPTFRSDYLPFSIIFLLLSLHWITGVRTIPWDAMDQFYPTSRFIVDSLRDGQLPWWNPYQYAGLPVFADPQSLLFTVFTPLGVLLGDAYTPSLFGSITLLHMMIGGLALIAYARNSDNTPLQRVLAALVFALAGVATSRLQHIPQIVTYAYLPIIIWSAHRAITRLHISDYCLLTLVLVLTFVNPNQVTLLGGLAAAYIVFTNWLYVPRKGAAAVGLLLSVATALLIASPVLGAVIELANLSNRLALTIKDSADASMPRSSLLALAFPGVFGTGGWHRVSWSPNDITENWLYIGAGATLLLAQSLILTRHLRKLWLLPAFFFFALFALGINSHLYPWLFEHVPGFSLFRRPSDGIYPALLLLSFMLLQPREFNNSPRRTFTLSVIIVAGLIVVTAISPLWGYADQRGQPKVFIENSALALFRFATIIALLCLAQRFWPQSWQHNPKSVALIALFLGLEMVMPTRFREFSGNTSEWSAGQIYHQNVRNEQGRELLQLLGMLRGERGDVTTPYFRFEANSGDLGNSHPGGFRVQSTQGYNPMRLKSYNTIIGTTASTSPRWYTMQAPNYNHPWFQSLGLRYVLLSTSQLENTQDGGDQAKTARLQRSQLSSFATKHPSPITGYEVWELPVYYPPVWLTTNQSMLEDMPSPPEKSLGECHLTIKQTHRILAHCDVKSTATAIFSEMYYPGWYVCVDQQPAQLSQGWGLLQAVQLASGQHTVSLQFEPVPFWRNRKCS